ncbi:MAG: signal peptidase I [Sideroxyarcus sp.]|nr:signal peptidase I [Sideroxyarcus sp.]
MKTINLKLFNTIDAWLWCMARLDAMHAHLVRYGFAYIALLFGYWAFSMKYEFNLNLSNSLRGTLYLVEKRSLPSRNDYAAFLYQSDFIYSKNARFLKRVVGVGGDTVESKNHQFFVNGKPVGTALPVTTTGLPIEESDFKGVIPPGHYYVMGDHPKSLDSRYKAVGLVLNQMILGRGYRLF